MSRGSHHNSDDKNRPGARRLAFERLENRTLLAGDLELVRDINTIGISSDGPTDLVQVGNLLFFVANDGVSGRELWKTDGTPGGAVRVKDIAPGPATSSPQQFTNVGGILYFTANDGVSGAELWKSDGTEAGTLRVKDIRAGAASSEVSSITNVGGVLFFAANDGVSGQQLWKSNGTEVGTVRVATTLSFDSVSNLKELNGLLYFSGSNGNLGSELWKSDGTALGTVLVEDIRVGTNSSSPSSLTNVSGTLYFAANDGTNGVELWKSDGTTVGTILVANISNSFTSSNPERLANVNGTLFFGANDGSSGFEVWRSDGTSSSTVLVKNIRPGSGQALYSELVNINGTLYFVANDGVNGSSLWKSNGTDATTVRVKDIRADTSDRIISSSFTNFNGLLYFIADDGVNGWALWRSNGTEAGTVLVKDFAAGGGGYTGPGIALVSGILYFSADNGVTGAELWRSDGTTAGTQPFQDISPRTIAGASFTSTLVGRTLYFQANDGSSGMELWKSDGTPAGTVQVKDLAPGAASSSLFGLTNASGMLYFATNDGAAGFSLWKSDGTESGTVRLRNVGTNPANAPGGFVNVGGTLFFTANDGVVGTELWKSDGTEIGTTLVKDIRPGLTSSGLDGLVSASGTLYFRASDGVSGSELWKSDGTDSGTMIVKDSAPGTGSSAPSNLTEVNGVVFFTAIDSTHGRELWKTDGSDAGTVFVKEITAGTSDGNLTSLTNVAGTLYFSANDGTFSKALWKSDGTEAGTILVRGKLGNSNQTFLGSLTNVNGVLFFQATTSGNGAELWKSDGTEAGTIQVKDLRLGSSSSYPTALTNIAGALYFVANDGVNGSELWKTDGTTGGTVPVRFASGQPLQSPTGLTADGQRLFVIGTHPIAGQELHALDLALAGDFDRDDVIAPADYDFWLARFGATTNPGLSADANEDGVIDAADFTIWRDAVGQFRDDFAGASSAAAPINVPDLVSGSITVATDADWFQFTATVGFEYQAQLALDGLSGGNVRVLGPDGVSLVASDVDGGAATLFWTATTTGPYFIEVSGFEGATGAYALKVLRDDHGDVSSIATTVVVPSTTLGELWRVSDADRFKVNATAGFEHRAQLALNGLTSGNVRVYGADGVTLVTSDLDGGAATVYWTPLTTGDYFIEVTSSDNAVGRYSLTLARDDRVSIPSTAVVAAVPSTTTGDVWSGTDRDWFRVDATVGFEYRAQLALTTLTSGALRVYAADGVTLVASDTDGGLAEALWTATATGPYYVEVSSAAGSTGMYSVSLSRDDFTGASTNATTINLSNAITGQIWSASDADRFTFTAVAGFEYRAELLLNALASGNLRIYAADGVTAVAVDQDGGDAAFFWTPETGGTFYLEVTGHEGATGGYSLRLRRDDHSNELAAGTSMFVPATLLGEIWNTSDVDWFKFTAFANYEHRAHLALNNAFTGELRIIGPDGVTLVTSDISGGIATTVWTPLVTGTHYLEVTASNGATGAYRLTLDRDNATETRAQAEPVSNFVTAGRIIGTDIDRDWFRFTPQSGVREYRAQLNLLGLPSAALRVYAPDGVTLVGSDVDGSAAEVIFANSLSGDYYFEVVGVGGSTGAYSVSVVTEDHGSVAARATTLNIPFTQTQTITTTGLISTPTDSDWFVLNGVSTNVEYRAQLTLTGLTSGGLRVRTSNGTILVASDVDGGVADVIWANLSTGTYVEVFGVGGAMGSYSLTVSREDHGATAVVATQVTAGSLSFQNSYAGNISFVGDSDWFRFTPTVNYEYRVRLDLAGLTSGALRVYAPDGVTVVASDLDGGAAELGWRATLSGTYYVEVVGVAGATGAYNLRLAIDDHAFATASATSASTSGNTGTIAFAGDADWFRFTATTGTDYISRLTLNTLTSGGLRIYAPDGATVLTSDLDGGAAVVVWPAVFSGNYYIEVVGAAGATGTYSLSLATEDHGSAANRHTFVATTSTTVGTIATPTDLDWLRFITAANTEYRAELILNGLSSGGFRVYGSDGTTVLASDLDGGAGTAIWTTAAAGNNYVEILGVGGATGAYSLALALEDHGGVATRATNVAVPSSTNGRVGSATDADWFRFNLVAGTAYDLGLVLGTLGGGTLRLYDSTGVTLLASDDDGGAASLSFTPQTTGAYVAQVTGFMESMGTYTLSLTPAPAAPIALATTAVSAISAADPPPQVEVPRRISTALFSTRRATFHVAERSNDPPRTESAAAARDEAFADFGQSLPLTKWRRLRPQITR